jgi:hypothetical protein
MLVTRSTNQSQVQVDLEIENTLCRLQKEARVNTMAVARQQTLKELAAPNVENQSLCINIDNNVNFDLKSGFIHLLPTFNWNLLVKILILISRSSIWFALA